VPLTLIGGGSRSGKSRQALTLARASTGPIAFIATAQAFDDEMRDRISRHQAERDASITTIEEPIELARAIVEASRTHGTILVDCLTLWLSNLMLSGTEDLAARTRELLAAIQPLSARVILVTNEVGCGIVPENALARAFRDEAGWMNQRTAEAADEVYWMIFGCALKLK
jgi:adenosylcobinamide kinase / adenosylcobinamide-phosphate guanylyltransferase